MGNSLVAADSRVGCCGPELDWSTAISVKCGRYESISIFKFESLKIYEAF